MFLAEMQFDRRISGQFCDVKRGRFFAVLTLHGRSPAIRITASSETTKELGCSHRATQGGSCYWVQKLLGFYQSPSYCQDWAACRWRVRKFFPKNKICTRSGARCRSGKSLLSCAYPPEVRLSVAGRGTAELDMLAFRSHWSDARSHDTISRSSEHLSRFARSTI